jgi:hypothetical protein
MPASIHDYWLFNRPPPARIWMPPASDTDEPLLIPELVNPTPAPPYAAHHTNLQIFLLSANPDTLQGICDRMLNLAGSDLVFRPVGGVVLFVAANIQMMVTAVPAAASPEKDFGFWIPVVQGTVDDNGHFNEDRFAFFMPMLWIDPPLGMTAGREIFGFRKSVGRLTQPLNDTDPERWSVEGYVVPRYQTPNQPPGPDSVYRWAPILEITGGQTRGDWPPRSSHTHSIGKLLHELKKFLDGELKIKRSFWTQVLKEMGGLQFPMFFLKQFPSISSPQHACYQAICWAQNSVVGPVQLQPISGPLTMKVETYDSCDLISGLGLKADDSGRLTISRAINIEFDFVVEPGEVLYDVRAPQPIPTPGTRNTMSVADSAAWRALADSTSAVRAPPETRDLDTEPTPEATPGPDMRDGLHEVMSGLRTIVDGVLGRQNDD